MAECSKCHKQHSRFRDAAHTRPQSYCAECHALFMRTTRPKHSELADEQRKAANARAYANVYQRRGLLAKQNCEVCGSEDSEKHHDSYDRPLDVRWVCRDCHLSLHRQEHQQEKGSIWLA